MKWLNILFKLCSGIYSSEDREAIEIIKLLTDIPIIMTNDNIFIIGTYYKYCPINIFNYYLLIFIFYTTCLVINTKAKNIIENIYGFYFDGLNLSHIGLELVIVKINYKFYNKIKNKHFNFKIIKKIM